MAGGRPGRDPRSAPGATARPAPDARGAASTGRSWEALPGSTVTRPSDPACSRRESLGEGGRHPIGLAIGQERIARERQALRPEPLRVRIAGEAERPMDRAKDGAPGRYPAARQVRHDGIEWLVDRDHEAVIYVALAAIGRYSAARSAHERRAISRRQRAPARDEGGEPWKLAATERGLYVGHLVVEGRRQVGPPAVVARGADAGVGGGGAA